MPFMKGTELSLTICAGLHRYSHLSLKSVQADGLISSNATSFILNLFALSGFQALEFFFQTAVKGHIGVRRLFGLARFCLLVI